MFITEQVAGLDVGAIQTFAEKRNGNWYLTGENGFALTLMLI